MSAPWVVGIRALAKHVTMGNSGRCCLCMSRLRASSPVDDMATGTGVEGTLEGVISGDTRCMVEKSIESEE